MRTGRRTTGTTFEVPVKIEVQPGSPHPLVDRVKAIFASRQLTLYEVSQKSEVLFGPSSPYFVSHHVYYEIARGNFSPSVFQLFALSRISNYRLCDWLRVFGFDLEVIPRLQIQLPADRTALLDSSLVDANDVVRWLRNSPNHSPLRFPIPLSQAVEWTKPVRLEAMGNLASGKFLYARIGYADTLAFPELLAGSLVRINPTITGDLLPKSVGRISRHLFLIEQEKGLLCCQLRRAASGRIAPVSVQLPYAQRECRVPEEARILGVADLEIRNLQALRPPVISKELAAPGRVLRIAAVPTRFGSLLRHARLRMSLSLRAASAISREIARLMGDERYFASPGALSDFEACEAPPRHVHKLVTFCVIYALSFSDILGSVGLSPLQAGTDPMPDALLGRAAPMAFEAPLKRENGVLDKLVADLEEIPFFLRGALPYLSPVTKPCLRDFFWLGGSCEALNPYLSRALLVLVNRRRKRPNGCNSKPLWQQPLFVVLKRDGTYLCACCSRENHSLLVHSYWGKSQAVEQFPDRDAEVIGQIVTIVRWIPGQT